MNFVAANTWRRFKADYQNNNQKDLSKTQHKQKSENRHHKASGQKTTWESGCIAHGGIVFCPSSSFKHEKKKPMDSKKNQEEQRQTPIADGDTRPDAPSNPQNEKSRGKNKENRHPEKDANKFESERQSDLNSLEDYKDAK